ncbi:putative peptidase [Lewinella aquimaris]|uniref:Putative peptidase n=1 Tax=Neolewinella aquimaris TaxID=1835722 RepID=A0A840E112_9BACT|nr:prolyl oligopeptidase family serine peptidase [Neolewinella aquimaris]MBB4077415.1 putative peptidase [Neolewinella aquimaris]
MKLTLFLLAACSFSLSAQFDRGSIDLGRDSMHYLVYYPEGYDTSTQDYPLVLFLHGGGEGGRDLEKVKRHGPPKRIAAGTNFPFILLAPQNRFERGFWDNVGLGYLLDDFLAANRVDTNRVYLTGLSRGGFAAWTLAMHTPQRFAALVPVCGAVAHSYDMWIPNDLPIWVHHGTEDELIHPSESVDMIENLQRKRMTPKPKLTLYEGVGHNAWDPAYDDPKLYEWMLAQRRH